MFNPFIKLSIIAFTFLSIFTSCEKDVVQNSQAQHLSNQKKGLVQKISTRSNQDSDNDDGKCFTINFPIEINIPNKGKVTVNSDDQIFDALLDYYGDDLDSKEDITFIYPINVKLESGEVKSIKSDEELDAIYNDCSFDDNELYEECYELVFPIQVKLEDGTTKVLNSYEDEWDFTSYVFPLSIKLKSGSIKVLNNEEDLYKVEEDCYGSDEPTVEDCYSIVFPVKIKLEDGSTKDLLNNEDAGIFLYDLVYPIKIKLKDGTLKTINNEKEHDQIDDQCL